MLEGSRRKHFFLGQKVFGIRPAGKHEFTSRESYDSLNAYQYVPVQVAELVKKIEE